MAANNSDNRYPDVLAEELKCGVCLDIFDTAVDTRCGHTFCLQCLTRVSLITKQCPECRQSLTADDYHYFMDPFVSTNAFTIGGGVWVAKNRRINSLIGKLWISCDYQWAGCRVRCPLDSLATHRLSCPYRRCRECGLAGDPQPHNCVDVLREDRDQLAAKCKALKTRLKTLEDMCPHMNALTLSAKYVKFGHLWARIGSVVVTDDGVNLVDVAPIDGERKVFFAVEIRYDSVVELSLQSDPSLRLYKHTLCVKPIAGSMAIIEELLSSGTDSTTRLAFNSKTGDAIEYKIDIQLSDKLIESVVKELADRCESVNSFLTCSHCNHN